MICLRNSIAVALRNIGLGLLQMCKISFPETRAQLSVFLFFILKTSLNKKHVLNIQNTEVYSEKSSSHPVLHPSSSHVSPSFISLLY